MGPEVSVEYLQLNDSMYFCLDVQKMDIHQGGTTCQTESIFATNVLSTFIGGEY